MDTISIRFEKLFSISLSHKDFPAPVAGKNWRTSLVNDIDIQPDDPTEVLFGKHQILYRFEYDTLFCFIRVEKDSNRPFHRLPIDFSARFILNASDSLIAKSGFSHTVGASKSYHIRVKLKTAVATSILNNSQLAEVHSFRPDLIFHPGYGSEPGYWERRPAPISGCLAVLDIVTEGSGKNRLFKQENTQVLNYTVANNKSDQHLYKLILKN